MELVNGTLVEALDTLPHIVGNCQKRGALTEVHGKGALSSGNELKLLLNRVVLSHVLN